MPYPLFRIRHCCCGHALDLVFSYIYADAEAMSPARYKTINGRLSDRPADGRTQSDAA